MREKDRKELRERTGGKKFSPVLSISLKGDSVT